MNVELKLDTAAVNALFPEGTEARVALQQAVINNITSNILDKRINEDIREQVRNAAAAMGVNDNLQTKVQTEMRRYLVEKGWNTRGKIQTSRLEEVKAIINQEVQDTTYQIFEDLIKKCTEEAKTKFADGMERKINYALSNAESHFSSRLNEKFKGILDLALAQRLGLEVKGDKE